MSELRVTWFDGQLISEENPTEKKNNVIRAGTISISTESSIDRKVPASQKDLQLKLILISLG